MSDPEFIRLGSCGVASYMYGCNLYQYIMQSSLEYSHETFCFAGKLLLRSVSLM